MNDEITEADHRHVDEGWQDVLNGIIDEHVEPEEAAFDEADTKGGE